MCALLQVMVWSWLEYRMSLQFIGLTSQGLFASITGLLSVQGVILNTFVHIVMYAFFALKVPRLNAFIGPTRTWRLW